MRGDKMANITERLAAIEARVEAATDGPWRARHERDGWGDWFYDIVHDYTTASGKVWPNQVLATADLSDNDAEFIAHARTDLPALLAVVKGVLALVDAPDASAGLVSKSAIRAAIREGLGR